MKRYYNLIITSILSLCLGSGITSFAFVSHYNNIAKENKEIDNVVTINTNEIENEETNDIITIDINEIKKEDFVKIDKFANPLPEKYMSRISSIQGLRDKLESNTGGIISENCYHNAIDIAVPEGTSVFATKSGRVVTVYPSYYNGGAKYYGHPIYGGLIEIEHDDGTKTMYAHLSYTIVREGDIVESGQKIGESGGVVGKRGSGKTTGPHLHYSIIMDLNTFSL